MSDISDLRVAVIATDGFEEPELTEPVRVLKEAGATVEILSAKLGQIQAFRHFDKSITVNLCLTNRLQTYLIQSNSTYPSTPKKFFGLHLTMLKKNMGKKKVLFELLGAL